MRTLPQRSNPLIAAEVSPSYEDLLDRRRLGRTTLTVNPGQVNSSNATRKQNLGPVDYAHLRAPLPDDLSNSEIFAPPPGQPHPATYFLMRNCKDGFVSATGMFKIAFPWATHAEEKAERDYLKTLESTSQDEIAGNVWVTPDAALELAAEYGMTRWIVALLDPVDILPSPASAKKNIAAPPKFEVPGEVAELADVRLSPPSTLSKGKKNKSIRAASPTKNTPARVKASPRKRQTKQEKEANLAHAEAASASLQSALDDAISVAEATPAPEVNGEVEASSPSNVKVEVDQSVEVKGGTEVTHTNVTVEMPAGLPDLPLPQDTESMLEKAKQMVEEAKALESSPKISRKRKVEDDVTDVDGELPIQPAKRARVLEERVKREKVRTRAVISAAASLAVAAAIPFLSNLF